VSLSGLERASEYFRDRPAPPRHPKSALPVLSLGAPARPLRQRGRRQPVATNAESAPAPASTYVRNNRRSVLAQLFKGCQPGHGHAARSVRGQLVMVAQQPVAMASPSLQVIPERNALCVDVSRRLLQRQASCPNSKVNSFARSLSLRLIVPKVHRALQQVRCRRYFVQQIELERFHLGAPTREPRGDHHLSRSGQAGQQPPHRDLPLHRCPRCPGSESRHGSGLASAVRPPLVSWSPSPPSRPDRARRAAQLREIRLQADWGVCGYKEHRRILVRIPMGEFKRGARLPHSAQPVHNSRGNARGIRANPAALASPRLASLAVSAKTRRAPLNSLPMLAKGRLPALSVGLRPRSKKTFRNRS
jgi:hypothetical protein